MKRNQKIILGIIGLIVAILALFFLYRIFQVPAEAGIKNITVEVILPNGDTKSYQYKTEQEYLGALLLEEKLAEGSVGDYGMFITTVDGVTADESKEQWWCVTKGGEQVNTSADTTPIFDLDTYELTLTEGY